MTTDYKNPSRTAQLLVVEYRRGVGNPPYYSSQWEPLWDVKIDKIEINAGAKPSSATIGFPNLRWNDSLPVRWGDMIRIRTDESSFSVLFVGFVVNMPFEFSGGTEKPGSSFEHPAIVCLDQRWVLSTTLLFFGQWARGPDDYDDDDNPLPDSDTRLLAQRTVFNPEFKPNRDPDDEESDYWPDFPLFCNPGMPGAEFWTVRDMIRFVLHPSWQPIKDYCPIEDSADIIGLELLPDDDQNMGKVLHDISIEGLNCIEALELICKHIGWNFRLDYYNDDTTEFVFYKIGIRTEAYRTDAMVISHSLYAPAVGESVVDAAKAGNKMLWSASVAQDITSIVNTPVAIGAPDKFEVTVELVPAWDDRRLTLPTDTDELWYYIDAELQNMAQAGDSPDTIKSYTRYNSRGIQYNNDAALRNVGRKWTLNESGLYDDEIPSPDDGKPHYDRGEAFDWSTVIPSEFIILKDDRSGKQKRTFAPYNRLLRPCLTIASDGLSCVPFKLELSFDAGATWQALNCNAHSLDKEFGIFIEDSNLLEIVDKKEGWILDGDYADIPLNLFSSICDDLKNERIYKDRFRAANDNTPAKKPWNTRVRLTACAQMDRRLKSVGKPSSSSGSPFRQVQYYDWSHKYGLAKRTASSAFLTAVTSVFSPGFVNALEHFDQSIADQHVDSIRKNNEDMSISGRFTLERLWTNDGTGEPVFMIGDSIDSIAGREYQLKLSAFGGGTISPEIVQIIYFPDAQKQVLITRDLRYAEVEV